MTESVGGLIRRIEKEWRQEASGIKRTLPTHHTCLNYNGMCEGSCGPCKEFIPNGWESHIYFNGEWWN